MTNPTRYLEICEDGVESKVERMKFKVPKVCSPGGVIPEGGIWTRRRGEDKDFGIYKDGGQGDMEKGWR